MQTDTKITIVTNEEMINHFEILMSKGHSPIEWLRFFNHPDGKEHGVYFASPDYVYQDKLLHQMNNTKDSFVTYKNNAEMFAAIGGLLDQVDNW